jgi:hypothetical protein
MEICDECGFDWNADSSAVVAEIGRFGAEYRSRHTRLIACDDGPTLRTRPFVTGVVRTGVRSPHARCLRLLPRSNRRSPPTRPPRDALGRLLVFG